MFFLKGNAVTDPDLKACIDDRTLSTVEPVTYLGVTFPNTAKWATNVEDIFRKYVRLFFFVEKLRRFIAPAEFSR